MRKEKDESQSQQFEINIMDYLGSQSTTNKVVVGNFILDLDAITTAAKKFLEVDNYSQVVIVRAEKGDNIYRVELN